MSRISSIAATGLPPFLFMRKWAGTECPHRHVREQGVVLEPGVDVACAAEPRTSTPSSRIAGGGVFESGDHSQLVV